MGVEVDEARGHHQALDVDHLAAGQRGARDRRDRVPVDADPPNGVEAGLGIDHPSLGQDEVVGLGRERCGAERRKSQR